MTNGRLGLLVSGLGVGQICSWGTLYYSIAVLGGRIGRDLGIDKPAVYGASCIGPMQVAGRIVEMLFGRHWSPIATGFFALSLLFASLALLYFTAGSVGLAFAFAIGYGWSNGILTIVRGTVPAVLLGRDSYGHLLGRLARATYLSQAAAPIAFSLLLAAGTGYEMGILALLAVALATLLTYYLATRRRTVGESSPTCGA